MDEPLGEPCQVAARSQYFTAELVGRDSVESVEREVMVRQSLARWRAKLVPCVEGSQEFAPPS
jgi:hypothetical protein